jgi:hypothetical protein
MQIDSKPNSVYKLSSELGIRSNINKPDVEARYARQVIELLPFKLRSFVRLLLVIGSRASNCTTKNTSDDIDNI